MLLAGPPTNSISLLVRFLAPIPHSERRFLAGEAGWCWEVFKKLHSTKDGLPLCCRNICRCHAIHHVELYQIFQATSLQVSIIIHMPKCGQRAYWRRLIFNCEYMDRAFSEHVVVCR